ncbi:hypothetical protein SAMN05444955_101229 [Lihuaxuella thermophila]|uniref:Uncharacterized protein n=1 Tax=Lihuaxuella thermophila TaxID=1173111 RepID=A0A1H8AQ30_9BACL|nr:hypothetical protein SAMN05444955_101229 [Lihuaxuella thermophila]
MVKFGKPLKRLIRLLPQKLPGGLQQKVKYAGGIIKM